MNPAELFGPEWLSLWLTGGALILLGAVLYLLDVSNRAQRLFALILVLRGLTFVLGPLRGEAESVRGSMLAAVLAPYAIVPLLPLTLAFLSLYPRPRGLGRTRWGPSTLLLCSLALTAWYLLDHASYAAVLATRPAQYRAYGPLFVLQGLRLPLLAAAGLVLALEYRKSPLGSRGFSMFLLVAGFTLNALFDGVFALIDLVEAVRTPATTWLPWDWSRWILPVLALPLGLATCIVLVPVLRLARTEADLQEVTRFFAAAIPLALATPLLRLAPYDDALPDTIFLMGVWRLLIPFLLAYALMRYQLFDIDIRLKAGMRRGILIGIFVAVFFVLSEAAEALVSNGQAPLVGVVGASVLAAVGKPIQAFAERAANGVMPDTKPIDRMGSQARFAMYREQFELVQQDGQVSPKERRMLTRLAAYLGIHNDESMDLEAGITPPRDDPAPPRPRRSPSRVARSIVAILGTAAVFGAVAALAEFAINASSFLTGLVTAAVVALLLGPIESLAERLTNRKRLSPVKAQTMRDALRDAWADGELSPRDVVFLDKMQARLGVSDRDRRRLEAEVRGASLPTRRPRASRRAA